MSEFVDRVRNTRRSQIAQPIQKGFSIHSWTSEFESIGPISNEDKRLYEIGIWVSKKLALIRKKLPIDTLASVPRSDLLRCIIGTLNRNTSLLLSLTADNISTLGDLNTAHVIQSGIPTITGQKATPDSAMETMIDAARFPLRVGLSRGEGESSTSPPADADIIDAVIKASVLGQYYSEIESIWNESLWEGWYLHPYKEVDFIIPGDTQRDQMNAVASFRRQSLQAETVGWSLSFWKEHPEFKSASPPRLAINIYGKGKQQKYKLEKVDETNASLSSFYARRLYAVQEYLDKALGLPLPKFDGITTNTLIQAWELLESLGRSLLRRLPSDTAMDKVKELKRFAPVLHLAKIIPLFARALGISNAKAEAIIDIFTSDNSVRDELWFKPLIRLRQGQMIPVLSPILHGSFLRIIEHWMKEGGIDLDQRGKLFEEHARIQIQSDIQASILSKCAGIHPRALTLPNFELDEEIDIVLWVNNKVLIGEAKCTLFPASPLELHNYFATLEGKASQAKRKANAARRNLRTLLKMLGIESVVTEDQVSILPFVLTNQAAGAGFLINEVPVIDLLILGRYFDGQWVKMGRFEDNKVISNDITYFYKTEKEASDRIDSYLTDPPQIKLYKDAVKLKHYPFPTLDANDRPFCNIFHEVELVETGLNLVEHG